MPTMCSRRWEANDPILTDIRTSIFMAFDCQEDGCFVSSRRLNRRSFDERQAVDALPFRCPVDGAITLVGAVS